MSSGRVWYLFTCLGGILRNATGTRLEIGPWMSSLRDLSESVWVSTSLPFSWMLLPYREASRELEVSTLYETRFSLYSGSFSFLDLPSPVINLCAG